ncbi:alpha/beta fold hydrolase [Cupriavidus sp. WKF15]|uniref:alpha/beta hydrolase n=1 Tax=Cupriavidus sp. WKF15 TaxID=3032282 RepID=UPI0023E230C6|nr:alpha/beta fold hydrolase [Cupriavidus sp. WKF15]WER48819.1 alpha/beta fold hydrolase [Cupriavidus sp. WKF15]
MKVNKIVDGKLLGGAVTGSRKTAAALLIHGLGGTEHELRLVEKTLKGEGYETKCAVLPGHGTRPEDLVGVRFEHWLEAVSVQYLEMRAEYETVHIVGMCMGALLALALSQLIGDRRGRVVALATPVFLDGWSLPWYRALRHLAYHIPKVRNNFRVKESEPFGVKNGVLRAAIKARFLRGDTFHYSWTPLACIRELDRLRSYVRKRIRCVTRPALIIHAREDELTSLRSAYFLSKHIRAAKLLVVDESYHMLSIDNDRRLVANTVAQFLAEDECSGQSRAARLSGAFPEPANEPFEPVVAGA